MRGSLRVTADARQAMHRHGAETYPDECCGALIVVNGVVVEAMPLANTTDAGPARRFTIDPDGYKLAEAAAMALGGTLAGFYHSHPDDAARPSQYDLEHAWPNFAYAIISVRAGVAADTRIWRLREDRSGFDEGELIWVIGS